MIPRRQGLKNSETQSLATFSSCKGRRNGKALLYQAALDLFVQKGYHPSTTDDICAKAGLAAALYRHFASKEDLGWQIFLNLNKDVAAGLAARVLPTRGTEERIRLIIDHLFDWCEKNPKGGVFLLLIRHSEIFTQQQKVIRNVRVNLRSLFEQVITDGIEAGDISCGDIAVCMKVIGIPLVFVRDRLERWDRRDLREYVNEATEMCCRALGMRAQEMPRTRAARRRSARVKGGDKG